MNPADLNPEHRRIRDEARARIARLMSGQAFKDALARADERLANVCNPPEETDEELRLRKKFENVPTSLLEHRLAVSDGDIDPDARLEHYRRMEITHVEAPVATEAELIE